MVGEVQHWPGRGKYLGAALPDPATCETNASFAVDFASAAVFAAVAAADDFVEHVVRVAVATAAAVFPEFSLKPPAFFSFH